MDWVDFGHDTCVPQLLGFFRMLDSPHSKPSSHGSITTPAMHTPLAQLALCIFDFISLSLVACHLNFECGELGRLRESGAI